MSLREQYQLDFKKEAIRDVFYYYVVSNVEGSNYIASHLTSSDLINSTSQIEELSDALGGRPLQAEWGEVFDSALEIHASL